MKTLVWILFVAVIALAGYVVWGLAKQPKKQTTPAPAAFEVSAESAAAYEQRVAELVARVELLKKRMVAAGTAERRAVKVRLAEFEREISDLKHAIAQWRLASGGDSPNEAYRQCLLLYGKARGVCDALGPDTLTGK
jgi:cytoskeletal protein RodZ